MMKIDQLPVEILMKIFNYLPRYDKVSLVNKHFYNVACSMSESKIRLRLYSELIEKEKYLQLLQSIKKTNRNITTISVFYTFPTDKQLRWTFSILQKFSATIKCFKFESYFLEMSDFLHMLSLVPNAECLHFASLNPERHGKQPLPKKRRVMPIDGDLNLHKLKTLTLRCCKEKFLAVFNRLPAGVLTELHSEYSNLNNLNVLFQRQTNMKKLSIYCQFQSNDLPSIEPDIFDNLKLESLDWRRGRSNIDTILSKQTKLKRLKLLSEPLNEDLMNVVTDGLTELDTLLINVSEIPVEAVNNINKLANLKNLTLRSHEDRSMAIFEQFAKLDNSRITTLDMQYISGISIDLISALAKSVPNLKILRFNCQKDYGIFNGIMRSFNFVEVLHFHNACGFYDYFPNDDIVDDLLQGECFNPNLIEFRNEYSCTYKRPFLKKLVADYPNLKKLILDSKDPFTGSQFKLILDGFPKMESLTLNSGASKLTIDDLDCISEHKIHLKFIALEDWSNKSTARYKKRLNAMFEVLKIGYGLIMAVDKETMNREYKLSCLDYE